MLIFDSFPDKEKAKEFVCAVRTKHGLKGTVHNNQDESNAIDPFPFELYPPIVLIDRADQQVERVVEKLVVEFGGSFAGT